MSNTNDTVNCKQLLAKKIEKGMKEKQLTRKQFAIMMNVQPSIITRWLKGNHNFTINTLYSIEESIGIKLIEI